MTGLTCLPLSTALPKFVFSLTASSFRPEITVGLSTVLPASVRSVFATLLPSDSEEPLTPPERTVPLPSATVPLPRPLFLNPVYVLVLYLYPEL